MFEAQILTCSSSLTVHGLLGARRAIGLPGELGARGPERLSGPGGEHPRSLQHRVNRLWLKRENKVSTTF